MCTVLRQEMGQLRKNLSEDYTFKEEPPLYNLESLGNDQNWSTLNPEQKKKRREEYSKNLDKLPAGSSNSMSCHCQLSL
jgi:hypothetical protein